MPHALTDEMIQEIEQRGGFTATPEEVTAARYEATLPTVEEVRCHYPAHVARYERAAEVLERLPVTKHFPVVDAATGVGYGTVVLADLLPSVPEFIALEQNPVLHWFADMHYMRPRIRRKIADLERPCMFVEGPAYHLISALVCIETIEHLSDPYPLLANARLHLHSDGLLILSTPHRPQGSPYHKHEYELSELEELLEVNDFDIMSLHVQEGTRFRGFARIEDLRGKSIFVVARKKA